MASGSVLELSHGTGIWADQEPDLQVETKNCWVVLHTKSRQEKALAEDLALLGIRHFLPVMREIHLHGERKVSVITPVFPGYLFLWGLITDAYRADRTRRVVRVIPVVDQTRLNRELLDLHRALVSGLPMARHAPLERGTPVEVQSGPLCGLRGVVENRLSPSRIILQVKMLGSAVSVDVSLDSVVPIQ